MERRTIGVPLPAMPALLAGSLLLWPALAAAEVPLEVEVAGRLMTAAGTDVDGPTNVTIHLYDKAAAPATLLYQETFSALPVSKGFFTVTLGATAGNPLPLSVFDRAGGVWLGTQVGSDPEMAPWARFRSAPFCYQALEAAAVPWSGITGIPAAFADGVDNDTTYTVAVGSGLTLGGTVLGTDPSILQRRVVGSCMSGQFMMAVGADGTVLCGGDVVYTAGTGVVIASDQIGLDTAYTDARYQKRVVGTCMSGQYMVSVGADGSAGCAAVPAAAPVAVGASNAQGTASTYALSDHVHAGVHAVKADANPALTGDVQLASGSGIALSQAGQTITVAASGGGGGGIPPGVIWPYGASSAPSGFLLCDGSAVSRTTYAALFAVIGTTYGAGDGSTTFNLPDLRGRFPLGTSGSHAMAATGGEESHTLTTAEMPSHSHSFGVNNSAGGDPNPLWNGGSFNHTVTTSATGGGAAHNTMPPYLTISYIIKS